jgi:thiol-disulfide isomerase/thioredoxin
MKMKSLLRAVAFGCAVWPALAADTGNPTNELNALVAKVKADIQAGKRTEAALADDLKQFDALLAEHKGEVTDAVAHILYMKALLYEEVIGDTAKAEALLDQLKREFKGTALVTALEKQEARETAAKQIQARLTVGAPFPDFHETDLNGKPVSVSGEKGKVLLIDFWATWCPPCRAELPNVIATYKKYHDQGFDIIGISLDQDKNTLENFLRQNGITWPQFFDGKGWDNKLAVQYGIEAIPATYLLDGSGKIIATDLRGEQLEAAVAKALAAK